MRVITAPEKYEYHLGDVKCFLAGGITNCPDWQSKVIKYVQQMDKEMDLRRLVLFNPRQKNFPINNPNAAEEQIKWEFDRLDNCSIFTMYFCNSDSDQPICMYELGRNIVCIQHEYENDWESRIIISVEDGYKRQKDVQVQVNLATHNNLIIMNGATPEQHAKAIIAAYNMLIK